MHSSCRIHSVWADWLTFAGIAIAITASGCTRSKSRLQADHDAYQVIAERNGDPRWQTPDYSIEIDPRSRYFDAYDPDFSPMPADDPGSHQYMHLVNGMRGWKHWHRNGDRIELENSVWREALQEYMELGANGGVKLDVDAALRLAYVHSPFHQRQLETLYLSALDVSAERFRLDTQFFGTNTTAWEHTGGLAPATIARTLMDPGGGPPVPGVDPVTRPFVLPAGPRPESNTLSTRTDLLMRRRFATAGELLAGFANSFVFEFTDGDVNLASSVANFSLVQPLLRGAGKDIALEQLTFEERKLLANLRAYSQFRQGFYTQVAIGELGVTGPQRFGSSTNLQSFVGQTGFSGYLGLLLQQQQIRNTQDNLALQLRTVARLEALLENDLIDLVQVDQFRQSVENERANLLLRQNAFELALDRYKTNTLGLPPNLPVELDDTLIRQFQLVPVEATEMQNSIIELQSVISSLPAIPEAAVLEQVLSDCQQFVQPVEQLFAAAEVDVERMEEAVPARQRMMSELQQQRFRGELAELVRRLADRRQEFDQLVLRLEALQNGLAEPTRRDTARGLTAWIAEFLQVVERLGLVPANARLEAITVDSIDLRPTDAFQVALANRLDFMNGRAALVDRWRSIQVNADALQSILNITASGDIRTARNNPVSFRAPTGTARLGLEFDAPFTRLLERNAYRESLIEYQRSRRDFIQSRDGLHLGLRALLRQIEQLRQALEIQRRAVTIAIRRVDQTQLLLNPPRPAPQPGQRPPINPTTAFNLLSAQTSLRDSQNAFLEVWLNYYVAKMRLYRELGIMVLDEEGRWIEYPIPDSPGGLPLDGHPDLEELPPPPMIPASDIEVANFLQPAGLPEITVRPASHTTRIPPRRLPPTSTTLDTNGYNSRRQQ